jgi:hypothetical protein
MAQRTYTYTAQDYRDVFNSRPTGQRSSGFVGVNRDGDLIWSGDKHIVWAYETMVLDHVDLQNYKPNEVVYSPSPLMKAEFDARQ